MALGKVQVDGGLFQIAMPQQDLNGAQIRTGLKQVSGEAMPQSVRVNFFLDTRSLGSRLARLPGHFGIDRVIRGVPAIAGK
jgi:hypothetical protein